MVPVEIIDKGLKNIPHFLNLSKNDPSSFEPQVIWGLNNNTIHYEIIIVIMGKMGKFINVYTYEIMVQNVIILHVIILIIIFVLHEGFTIYWSN